MRLRWIPALLGLLAALLVLLAGPGTRLGAWDFRTGFSLLRWGAYVGLAAAATAVVLFLIRPKSGGAVPLSLGLLLGLGAAFLPWYWMRQAGRVPPIHDITTDPDRPPRFVAVVPLREGSPNSLTYGGAEVAEAQRRAYPDIKPLVLALSPGAAFTRALASAQGMGWKIVAADSAAGRIEATATTPWFGFKDDVVVRVRPESSGSRIDVRSVSRVGQSDVGANARRIRAYLADLARRDSQS
jgi:uncharacterized protein (DUF1499 family)